jgi:hypothetical protein
MGTGAVCRCVALAIHLQSLHDILREEMYLYFGQGIAHHKAYAPTHKKTYEKVHIRASNVIAQPRPADYCCFRLRNDANDTVKRGYKH